MVSSNQPGASVWKHRVHCIAAKYLHKNANNFKQAHQHLSFDLLMTSSFNEVWNAKSCAWQIQTANLSKVNKRKTYFAIHCKNARKTEALVKGEVRCCISLLSVESRLKRVGLIDSVRYFHCLSCQIGQFICSNTHRSVLLGEEWMVVQNGSDNFK